LYMYFRSFLMCVCVVNRYRTVYETY
jgi:hypothetical protein